MFSDCWIVLFFTRLCISNGSNFFSLYIFPADCLIALFISGLLYVIWITYKVRGDAVGLFPSLSHCLIW